MMLRRFLLGFLGATLFCVLAILNIGGYRYGVQDQWFYIPAVLQHLDPGLYPRDAMVLGAQARYFVFDDAIGQLVRLTGWSLPPIFFGLFMAGLVLLCVSIACTGWSLYRSWWAVAGMTLGVTLRHQISMTGVNSLEGYLHPRMLAFAVGLSAVALFLRGRSRLALAVVVVAGCLHPTTALWFLILTGTAVVVADRPMRRPLLLLALVGAPAALWVATTALGDSLVLMDDAWLSIIALKSYLFATGWSWTAWLANLGTAAVIGGVYTYRRTRGLVSPRETGLVAGCAALLLVFVAALPLVGMRVALALQLQTGRIFWILDILAIASLAWLLTESDIWLRRGWSPVVARRVVVALVALTAVARGGYVTFIEYPERPIVSLEPADTDWTRLMEWVAQTPPGTHLLADPAHAWRHGASVRVTGQRDVFLEEVKDPALAIYSRAVAQRVLERLHDLDRFDTLTADRARVLADKYDLHYLVADRSFDLPLAHQVGPFRAYTLRPPSTPHAAGPAGGPMR